MISYFIYIYVDLNSAAEEYGLDLDLRNRANLFPYGQISRNIMPGFPAKEMDAESCRMACLDDLECIAWETCAPVGDGCDGCYLIQKKAPREFSDRPGWHAEIIESRAENLTLEEFVYSFRTCYDFVFEANGGVNEGEFGDMEALSQF